MSQLPDTLSGLIRVALADLAKVEADPRYEVDMMIWHMPEGDVCVVCFAGAVMAGSLGIEHTRYTNPEMFDRITERSLTTLNFLRSGLVRYGSFEFGMTPVEGFDRSITPYEKNSARFRADMERLASDLEAAGL